MVIVVPTAAESQQREQRSIDRLVTCLIAAEAAAPTREMRARVDERNARENDCDGKEESP